VPVDQVAELFVRPARRLIGPPDAVLQALAADGLTLREIGERVGMSAEGVRWRLSRAAAVAG
jgi:DNA-directed RNA polymerase specialized sigma24 family protein